mmetsp:Transcript_9002/g.26756  ORF Transcript_9002/g.26756 Transcript_9002/m.26756 type:complete len:616 (-) Transcript_9002:1306-3153(-)|eukprot:CAMPEP_0172366558 /NCGR_PEP_ID=MMETSP1060-20121228/16138_1 /TAXON_ID=37318 /ORGANISM="Pseudo-nitzschia pungens, Strain cf. cingulata" /LENGTH=615 /DNA_ID=CAMNT_0013090481 /DNA_START=88 /DNA_END=1935 /DNA_ORIENTATION=-
MPAHYRDKRVREEAQIFCKSKSAYPIHCKHFKPTADELRSSTFSEYIRNTVLNECQEGYSDSEEEQPIRVNDKSVVGSISNNESSKRYRANSPKISFDYGLAKVTLPEGFSNLEGIAKDQTGRGADWQSGTRLGDMILPSPMTQVVHGIGGVYEFTFLDNDPITVAEFREKADIYMESQIGGKKDHSIEMLERKFWKRLGPTMQSSMYGADMDGTMFSEDDDSDWNLSKLQSCLQLLLIDQKDDKYGGIPGVTTPYLYFGMWASVFCAHTEDMNLFSINYLHAGAPKIWYAVAEGEDSRRFENLMESNYVHAKKDCPEYLRHKRSLVSPAVLKKAGIPYTMTVQYPGDAIITFPGSYHSGFNTGFNVAEATNFATPEWIPYGRTAKVCNCRPDSVRMDVNKFENLLLRYEREVLQTKRVSWKDWVTRVKKKRLEEEISNASYGSDPKKAKKTHGETKKAGKNLKFKDFWVEVMQPTVAKSTKKSKSKRSRKQGGTEDMEIWHLAKPVSRKSLQPSDRVLCIIPAIVDRNDGRDRSSIESDESEEEGEECFAGYVFERLNDDIRIRLDGMGTKEDIWMSINSPKLFMDGGKWKEDNDFKMPAKHYWKEEDFSQKCM